MTRRLMLLDTASLYFRAFYGVPDSFRAPDGTPINAVRGLLEFIARLVAEYQPTELVCCWDNNWRPSWRVELLPSYKEHRVVAHTPSGRPDIEEVPAQLQTQIPVIEETLAALGIAVVGVDDYEADDVIGTLATQAEYPVDIVTGDRDLFQLVDDETEVRVLYTARGVSRHERITDQVIVDKYGVHGWQYADFATLRGDASDGLPGVAGIGEKTAATLLQRHGSLLGIVQAAADEHSDLGPGPRAKVLRALDYLAAAPQVVHVARDLALPDHNRQLSAVPAEPEKVAALATRWGLTSSIERVLTAVNSH